MKSTAIDKPENEQQQQMSISASYAHSSMIKIFSFFSSDPWESWEAFERKHVAWDNFERKFIHLHETISSANSFTCTSKLRAQTRSLERGNFERKFIHLHETISSANSFTCKRHMRKFRAQPRSLAWDRSLRIIRSSIRAQTCPLARRNFGRNYFTCMRPIHENH